MCQHKRYNRIPTQMCEGDFNEFVLPGLEKLLPKKQQIKFDLYAL